MKTSPLVDIPRFSLGVVYTGVQARWRMVTRLGFELRFLQDGATSDTGESTAHILGGRVYFFSLPRQRFTFYGGGEGGAVVVKTPEASLSMTGTVWGGFTGVEYRLSHRFSWGMDVGLYQMSLKESSSGLSESGPDFVINSFVNFHIL